MRGLDPAVATKLTKVLSLLGSDHAGERSAAAWHATRLLKANGLSWDDLFVPVSAPPPLAPPPMRAPHVADALWASQFPDRLTAWERKFLADIGRCHRISAKQAAWLADIVRELRGGNGA